MKSVKYAYQSLLIIAMATTLTACKNGGNVNIEPGARKDKVLGSPYVQANQGGKALIYEATRSPATATQGVHGWVSIQAVTSSHLSSASGTNLIMNRPQH